MTPTEDTLFKAKGSAAEKSISTMLERSIIRKFSIIRAHVDTDTTINPNALILSTLIKVLHDQLVVVLLEDPEGTVDFLTTIVTESVTLAAEEAAEIREESENSVKQ
jgi:hypothetical protein